MSNLITDYNKNGNNSMDKRPDQSNKNIEEYILTNFNNTNTEFPIHNNMNINSRGFEIGNIIDVDSSLKRNKMTNKNNINQLFPRLNNIKGNYISYNPTQAIRPNISNNKNKHIYNRESNIMSDFMKQHIQNSVHIVHEDAAIHCNNQKWVRGGESTRE